MHPPGERAQLFGRRLEPDTLLENPPLSGGFVLRHADEVPIVRRLRHLGGLSFISTPDVRRLRGLWRTGTDRKDRPSRVVFVTLVGSIPGHPGFRQGGRMRRGCDGAGDRSFLVNVFVLRHRYLESMSREPLDQDPAICVAILTRTEGCHVFP